MARAKSTYYASANYTNLFAFCFSLFIYFLNSTFVKQLSLTLSMYVGTKIITVYCASLFVDHAGWTPLHEACNHGSTECVKALLQHCPNLQLGNQVQGVSPLHDALLNQHTHIAEMLLRRGGECPTYTYIHSEIRPSQNNTYIHTLNA